MTDLGSVSVVDDDASLRESLEALLRSVGFAVEVFASAEAFLKSDRLKSTRCLIVDIRMPGMNGLDLQRELTANRCAIPIIFITAHGDAARPHALERGAVDYLLKPFSEEALLNAIHAAVGSN